MLDRIRNSSLFRATNILMLVGVAIGLSSCATKRQAPLISDNAAGRESQIPWNQQEKWEGQGTLGPLAEKMQSR